MGKKPKTRIGITVEGRICELFSVRERSNGDLLLVMRNAENYEDSPTDVVGFETQRYSVHRSIQSKSPGITIKQTIDLKDGRQISTAQFREPVDGTILAPLYAKTCPSLDLPRYQMAIGKRDRVVLVSDHDLKNQLMFYAVAVSTTVPDDSLLRAGFVVHAIQFTHFFLCVFCGYFAAPSLPQADVLHAMTSQRRVDGVPELPSLPPDLATLSVKSFSADTLALFLKTCITHLGAAMLERHKRLVFTDGSSPSAEQLADVAEGLRVCLPYPVDHFKQRAG